MLEFAAEPANSIVKSFGENLPELLKNHLTIGKSVKP